MTSSAPGRPTTSVHPHDRDRLLLSGFLYAVFLQGAARKWVLPGASDVLYLLRDPLILYGCLSASAHGRRSVRRAAGALAALMLLLLTWAAAQILWVGAAPTVTIVGLRGYLVAPATLLALSVWLSRVDYRAVIPHLAALTVAQVPIAALQNLSPRGALINRLLAENGSDNLGLTAASVRATGTFTSNAGLTAILITMLGIGVVTYYNDRTLASRVLVAAALTGISLAGSRGALAGGILVLAGAFIVPGHLRGGQSRVRRGALIVSLVAVVTFTTMSFAPDYVKNLRQRVTTAGMQEDTSARLAGQLFGWVGAYKDASVLGGGLGGAGNFALAVDSRTDWVETELDRMVYEAGSLLGYVLIGGRVAATFFFLHLAINARRRGRDVMPLLLAVAPVTLVGAITTQGDAAAAAALGAAWLIAVSRRHDPAAPAS